MPSFFLITGIAVLVLAAILGFIGLRLERHSLVGLAVAASVSVMIVMGIASYGPELLGSL